MAISQKHQEAFCHGDPGRGGCIFMATMSAPGRPDGMAVVCTKVNRSPAADPLYSADAHRPWGGPPSDPSGNCQGYPLFVYNEQGYDVPERP